MRQANLLGEFLRARRAQLHPEEVGLPARDGRRVSGLRREELALLAGVSSDYYTRLEQGRSLPSLQVSQALAEALKLDAAATRHLHQLARGAPEYRFEDQDTNSAQGLQTLLDQWPTTPAWVSRLSIRRRGLTRFPQVYPSSSRTPLSVCDRTLAFSR